MDPLFEIIAQKAGRSEICVGDIVDVVVDRVYLQDGNAPTVARLFDMYGFTRVFDPERIGVFVDHSVLAPDVPMRNRVIDAERFAKRLGLRFFPAGTGISHLVALEQGWFSPGDLVVGADSHTCTGAACDALAFGLGASDVTAAMVTGRTWLRVPEIVVIEATGTGQPWLRPRDVALRMLGTYGQKPFLGKGLVWTGAWIERLSPDDRAGLANLTVELGAFCSRIERSARPVSGPAHVHVDLARIEPTISRPHDPASAVPLSEAAGTHVDEVFIGSCASSRLADIATAAAILRGRELATHLQCVVTPSTRQTYLQALDAGYIRDLVSAGVLVTPPGCGSCVGVQGPIPASGSTVLSTMNRNFRGRMGNPEADIWLGSPAVAASAAVLGRIPTLFELSELSDAGTP